MKDNKILNQEQSGVPIDTIRKERGKVRARQKLTRRGPPLGCPRQDQAQVKAGRYCGGRDIKRIVWLKFTLPTHSVQPTLNVSLTKSVSTSSAAMSEVASGSGGRGAYRIFFMTSGAVSAQNGSLEATAGGPLSVPCFCL